MPAQAPDSAISISPALSLQSEALLAELECWRELLARDLIENYPAITEPDLNHSLLLAILRILFLKAGEERGFVMHGTLRKLSESDRIHRRICGPEGDAGIMALTGVFKADDTSRVPPVIGDETLRTIIGRSGSFDFPAPFSAIPLPELAGMFERYLGSKMRIAEGYRVKKDTKSMVRDAGGVHIPPHPVVRYIVRETVGRLLEGKTPRQVSGLHILDPAFGSGIFLLAAYRHLLDWHLDWYRTHLVSILASGEPVTTAGIQTLASGFPATDKDCEPKEPDLPVRYCGDGDPATPGSWTLSQAERTRILITSLTGIDIDPEATGIARFLLLYATLDEFSPAGVDQTDIVGLCRTAEQLRQTIRCGNALIGPDYFTHSQEHPFNISERNRVNAFGWQAAFPEIVASGGFDAVIGAPPLHRPFSMKSRDEYFQMRYATYAKTAGLYGYFIERGLSLLKDGGTLSFVVPELFLRAHHARPLRRLLLAYQIEEMVNFRDCRALQAPKVRTYLLHITKREPDHAFRVSEAELSGMTIHEEVTITNWFAIDQRSMDDGGWTLEDRRIQNLLEKLRATGSPLEDYVMGQVEQGTVHIRSNPMVIDARTRTGFIKKDWRCKKLFRPLLRPADIERYRPEKPERFLITAKNSRELKRCRAVYKYVQAAAAPSGSGERGAGPSPAHKEKTSGEPALSSLLVILVPMPKIPKIIYAPAQENPKFSFDANGSFALTSTLAFIPRNDPVLVAILNATLGRFIITHTCPHGDRGYQLTREYLGKFPVYTPDLDDPADKARHDRMVAHVTQMLSLHEYLQKAKTDQEKRLVQQEIDATDVKIDALVYELYGLSAEEIAIIEETAP